MISIEKSRFEKSTKDAKPIRVHVKTRASREAYEGVY